MLNFEDTKRCCTVSTLEKSAEFFETAVQFSFWPILQVETSGDKKRQVDKLFKRLKQSCTTPFKPGVVLKECECVVLEVCTTGIRSEKFAPNLYRESVLIILKSCWWKIILVSCPVTTQAISNTAWMILRKLLFFPDTKTRDFWQKNLILSRRTNH